MTDETKTMDFDTFTSEVRTMLELRVSCFDAPEDDLQPTCVFYSDDSGMSIAIFDGQFLRDDEMKDVLSVRMAYLAGKNRCRYIAFTSTAWASLDAEGIKKGRRPSEDPKRQEIVVAFLAERRTNKKDPVGRELYMSASLTRQGKKPPLLGPWEKMEGKVGGRFPDTLRTALAIGDLMPEIEKMAKVMELSQADADHYTQRAIANILGSDPDNIKQEEFGVLNLDQAAEYFKGARIRQS